MFADVTRRLTIGSEPFRRVLLDPRDDFGVGRLPAFVGRQRASS
jgi:hypothetical protein